MRRILALVTLTCLITVDTPSFADETTSPCFGTENFVHQSMPVYSTPDALMEAFLSAYTQRDLDRYAHLLHREFEFHLAPENRQMAPPNGIWGRDRELESAEKMFSGGVGWTSDGTMIPPVTNIKLTLAAAEGWSAAKDLPDAQTRSYLVHLTVEFGIRPPIIVQRVQEFTVIAKRFEHNVALTDYRLLRWREASGGSCPARADRLVARAVQNSH